MQNEQSIDLNEQNHETAEGVTNPTSDEQPDLHVQLAEMKDQWLRAVAETENLRRRFEREKEEAFKYAATHFARDMVTIVDYLEKALEHDLDTSTLPVNVKALVDGIVMTKNELHVILGRHGVKKVDPENKSFDPNYHQAMAEVEANDATPGEIVHIVQNGYTIHDRLLRPSMVTVAKKI